MSNGTTTASQYTTDFNDDEIGLIRRRSTGSSKKKSGGIFRTLFRFGSKKFKDKEKQAKVSAAQNTKKELEEEVEKIRARKAALYEQERIQEYYRRLLDQQKFNEVVSQQSQRFSQTPTQSHSRSSQRRTNGSEMNLYGTRSAYNPQVNDVGDHKMISSELQDPYAVEVRTIENTQVKSNFASN